MALVGYSLSLFLLMRFGLVASVLVWFVEFSFRRILITLDTSAWYAPYGFAALGILALIVLYSFRTSLAGQPLFGRVWLED